MGIDAEIDENGKLHVKRLSKEEQEEQKKFEARIQELN